jgi:hypothetical protein
MRWLHGLQTVLPGIASRCPHDWHLPTALRFCLLLLTDLSAPSRQLSHLVLDLVLTGLPQLIHLPAAAFLARFTVARLRSFSLQLSQSELPLLLAAPHLPQSPFAILSLYGDITVASPIV